MRLALDQARGEQVDLDRIVAGPAGRTVIGRSRRWW
jgi:hypothetical protein